MTDFAGLRTKMVDSQVRPNDVTDHRLIDALLTVPRESFVPVSQHDLAYIDRNIPLGNGRVLLQAMLVAKLLQAADIGSGDDVVEIGASTGYTAAVLSHLAKSVVAVESDAALAATAEASLKGYANVRLMKAAMTSVAAGSADVIIVSGAVEVLPEALRKGLKEGGRLVVIEGVGHAARAMVYTRSGATVSGRSFMNAAAPVLPGFEREIAFQL